MRNLGVFRWLGVYGLGAKGGRWRGMYDGVLKSCACRRRGGHRGEIRLRGSEGKPNPSPSQKHPKADYLLQWERKRGMKEKERRRGAWDGWGSRERERAISIDAILAQSSDLIFDLLRESCQIWPEKHRRTIWQSAAGGWVQCDSKPPYANGRM